MNDIKLSNIIRRVCINPFLKTIYPNIVIQAMKKPEEAIVIIEIVSSRQIRLLLTPPKSRIVRALE